MAWLGNRDLESTFYHRFTSRQFSTGAPFLLGGSPVLSVYEENNLTQITAGVSVSADYDSVTGLNQATIVATAANGYEAGKSYDIVITVGTVDSVSVVGEVVGTFRIKFAWEANMKLAGDAYSVTRGLSGTALPAVAADAAGGLPISDAGGLDLDTKLANTNEVTAARMGALTDWINGGRLDLIIDLILEDTGELQTNQGAWATATGFNTTTPDAAGTAATLLGVNGLSLSAIPDLAGVTTLLSRITALLQTKAQADTAHGLLATEAKQDTMQTAQDLIPTTMVGTDGALTAIQDSDLNADLDVYEAKIGVIDDEGGTTDRWVVMWFKNGAPVLSGITSPTVQCVKTADGTDLFAAAAMTEITAGMYRKTQATTRIVSGVGYCAVAVATIGGSARTHREVIGRDSTA